MTYRFWVAVPTLALAGALTAHTIDSRPVIAAPAPRAGCVDAGRPDRAGAHRLQLRSRARPRRPHAAAAARRRRTCSSWTSPPP